MVVDIDCTLSVFTIYGNVTFSTTKDVTLTATYIKVADTGYFWIGQRNMPHPANVAARIVSLSRAKFLQQLS